ncbi:hypothetical protein V493_01810 [Pseudogymnoascus sp. VKM F-4281 (FW-2241)]|nr:hypothetical protein V493_01810 [Pseudogymnoascus sp. VKM F-4281 (FW-2241)]
MCPPTLPSSTPAADADTDSDQDFKSPYTPSELAAIILDFYTFLTTLHFPASGLKLPPHGGWPNITQTSSPYFSSKSPLAIEVLRQLAYFDKSTDAPVHYKSRLIDHPSLLLETDEDLFYSPIDFDSAEGYSVDPRDVVCLARGHESGGVQLFLDVRRGEMTEDEVRCDTKDAVDVVVFFERFKEKYRSMKLIACADYEIIVIEEREDRVVEAEEAEEDGEEVSTEVMLSQEEEWYTATDVRWVRGLYRRLGWPDSFQSLEAERVINEAMSEMWGTRGGWNFSHMGALDWCSYSDEVVVGAKSEDVRKIGEDEVSLRVADISIL